MASTLKKKPGTMPATDAPASSRSTERLDTAARMQGIAARIRSLRTRAGMTLDQLAAATGLDKGYLSRLER